MSYTCAPSEYGDGSSIVMVESARRRTSSQWSANEAVLDEDGSAGALPL